MSYDVKTLTEIFNSTCGVLLGDGMSRKVVSMKYSDDYVLKIEEGEHCFQNVIEWETWKTVQFTEFAKYFAPCKEISGDGRVLVMARTTLPSRRQYPERLPKFLTDFKFANYGVYRKRVVCHDYGTNLLQTVGLTKAMQTVYWWE